MENTTIIVEIPLTLDPDLLMKQKLFLLSLPENKEIDGLINLIDYIQDFAVDKLGYPEKVVFPG
jgi:hypothetical protein